MSAPPKHPIFSASLPGGSGCGHAHRTHGAAENCAKATADRYTKLNVRLPYVEVVEIALRGGSPQEKVVGRIEQSKPNG